MVPKDFIRYKVKQLEKNSPYYKTITTTSKTIDEVIENIKQSKEKVLTLEQFNTIKELAVNKGGFLSMENRRFLYKKILNVNEKKIPLTEAQYQKRKHNGQVPQGMILAVGDNYPDSVDSRDYGFVPVENVLGRIVTR